MTDNQYSPKEFKEKCNERLVICQNCSDKKDWIGKLFGEATARRYVQCGKCNCLMNIKVKIRTMTCPIGKWDQF